MRYIVLCLALLLPAISYADAQTGSAAPKLSLNTLLFIIGAVASMLFVKGRQNADYHTGFIPIFQSVVIVVCFFWSHYILLVVEDVSLFQFYSNFILHIDKGIGAFLCVVMLYVGFAAVIYRTVSIAMAKLKR